MIIIIIVIKLILINDYLMNEAEKRFRLFKERVKILSSFLP